MTEILGGVSDFIWGSPLLIFLFVANLILVYYSRFLPLTGLVHGVKLLLQKKEVGESSLGQISHFQAFCNAIAATVGLGNISGVAIAISLGGPGALLWMWIAAIFGMNTKFFECTVAQILRGKDYKGEVQGGAMYAIEKALPRLKVMGVLFSVCGLIGTLSLFQINQVALFAESFYGVPDYQTGLLFTVLVGIILWGGLTSISRTCSVIVPVMSVLYILIVLTIVFLNYEKIPSVITLIFTEAMSPSSAFGGIAGYGFIHILTTGLKRATFSNEAGIGTAPMAHSNSKTAVPITEGYVAMLGPLLDTIIVCSMTAFAILVTFPEGAPTGMSGIELTTRAFVMHLGPTGKHLLAIIILLFSFSTMIGMANYNQKCWDYLFRGRWGLGDKVFIVVYSLSILMGAVIPMMSVIHLMDIAYALMSVPNIIVTVYMASRVRQELKNYHWDLK
jgi:alanine or glycine:cation symporter, AGCS family